MGKQKNLLPRERRNLKGKPGFGSGETDLGETAGGGEEPWFRLIWGSVIAAWVEEEESVPSAVVVGKKYRMG